jgi:hypothetical protein
MQERQQNIWSGGALLLLCVVLFVQIPGQVGSSDGYSLSPAFLPTLISAIIAVMSAILIIQGVMATAEVRSKPLKQSMVEAGYVGLTVLAMIGYVSVLEWLGFIAATAIVIVVLALLYGNRNWVQIIVTAIVAPPLIMLFFRYAMLVLLPEGTLFN